jgi:transposase
VEAVDSKELSFSELKQQNAELKQLVAQLQERVALLEEMHRKSSRNSSKPPSSDGPAGPQRKYHKSKKRSGKKRGAQPGHVKAERALVPPERVDHHTDCVPEECEHCGNKLSAMGLRPHRHQVFELPPIQPIVHEYALHAGECDDCGRVTRATLPMGVPSRAFGPSVDATVAVLVGVYRLSKRGVQSLLHNMFGLDLSLGAVLDCQNVVSAALLEPYDQAAKFARQQPVKNADETSWREQRKLCWLWTLVTPLVTVFMIHSRRNAEAARELLGPPIGMLGTDRHGAYRWWPLWNWQACWSHLIRDFTAIYERGGHSGKLGGVLLEESKQLFKWYHQVRDGSLKRQTFQRYVSSLKARVNKALKEGRDECKHSKTSGTCKAMLKVFPAFWLFVEHEDVEPTNNSSEQTVRHGVMMRKVSFGTQSAAGSRFIERILTAHATLLRQKRNILDFIKSACVAQLHKTKPPSLLPTKPFDQSN